MCRGGILARFLQWLNYINIVPYCVSLKETDKFHSFICLSVCSSGPRLGKAGGLLRPGPSWICDEDSAIRHGRRLNGHNRGCG